MAAILFRLQYVNSLWPSDAIWWQRSGSTVAQVIAFLPDGTKPLPQLVHLSVRSSDIHLRAISEEIPQPSITEFSLKIKNYLSEISFKSPRWQWVNSSDAGDKILQLWGSVSCLLLFWLLKSPEHQQARYWLCRTDNLFVVPEFISSTWIKPNPIYDSKCEYNFNDL